MAPFWVDPSKGGLQLCLASSTVLTLIAYRFLLASLVPKLSYLTRLDYLSLGGTILVFAAFPQVLVTSVLGYSKGRGPPARCICDAVGCFRLCLARSSSGRSSCESAATAPAADPRTATCTACVARHSTSIALAKEHKTYGQCHMGPDHSQIESCSESKHGVLFNALDLSQA